VKKKQAKKVEEENTNITNTPEWRELQALIVPFFYGDVRKFESWMMIGNPMLGGVMPIEMLFLGRGEKLIKITKELLSQNKQK
jgi:hypothetical protein